MALNIRRLAGLCILAGAIGCPKTVSVPKAQIAGGDTISNVLIGQVVRLDGSPSADADGRELSFDWTFAQLPSGSAATLNDARSQSPSFVADVDGTYAVQLIVSNAFLTSAPARVTVQVTKCGGRAPVTGTITPALPAGVSVLGVGTLVSFTAPDEANADPDNSTTDGVC